MESTNRKTGEKAFIFHYAVEMKQPYAMTEPSKKAIKNT